MKDLKYRLYCAIHNITKKILGRSTLTTANILSSECISLGVTTIDSNKKWSRFIESSVIPELSDYSGTLYAGYILEKKEWCLPSWIWTNAAIIRMYCGIGQIERAKELAAAIANQQQDCGGWIVRNDYDKKGAIPMLAPNDSAYIANNAFISLYLSTKDITYLNIAKRCADWIVETARPDGMVYVGYNMRDKYWDKNCVIVDVGFTGGLFARLYEITKDNKYLDFLKVFINRYIDLFFIPLKHGFATSIDKHDCQQGGMFGRGQAWALEGLIPAYKVLKDNHIKEIIDDTINTLVKLQLKNGAWSYNFAKPLLGEDCKSVSVIARDMMEWNTVFPNKKISDSAIRALNWCMKQTANEGPAEGGIFSFCMEGAVVQNLYTSCAFVYASAYAIELQNLLKNV